MKNIETEETFFPDLIPTSQCEARLEELKSSILNYLVFWIGSWILTCFIFILWINTMLNEGNHTHLALLIPLFIVSIIFSVLLAKKSQQEQSLKSIININQQYTTFLQQGFDKKDSYRLTLEWIDRQKQIKAIREALNNAAAVGACATIAFLNNSHKQ